MTFIGSLAYRIGMDGGTPYPANRSDQIDPELAAELVRMAASRLGVDLLTLGNTICHESARARPVDLDARGCPWSCGRGGFAMFLLEGARDQHDSMQGAHRLVHERQVILLRRLGGRGLRRLGHRGPLVVGARTPLPALLPLSTRGRRGTCRGSRHSPLAPRRSRAVSDPARPLPNPSTGPKRVRSGRAAAAGWLA